MAEESEKKEPQKSNSLITLINKTRLGQFLFLFILIMILFYCIEVIPFYTQHHHSMQETMLLVKRRLPFVASIAAVASLYIVSRRRGPRR
jgi:hypothetical protein